MTETASCPECGARMTFETREDTIAYRGRKLSILILAFWCTECGEAIFEGEALAEREAELWKFRAEVDAEMKGAERT